MDTKRTVDDAIEVYEANSKPRLYQHIPVTMHYELYQQVFEDNKLLVEEVKRLRQLVSDETAQRTLEGVRALEAKFPMKGRKK